MTVINSSSVGFKKIDDQLLESTSMKHRANLSEKPDTVEIKNKKEKPVRSFWGGLAALLLGNTVYQDGRKITAMGLLPVAAKEGTFTGEDATTVVDAIKKTHVESGLKDKGVRIKFLNKRVPIRKSANITDPKATIYKDMIDNMLVNSVRNGENAFFVPKDIKLPKVTFDEFMELSQKGDNKLLSAKLKDLKTYIKGNSILLSPEKFQGPGFHELGHAMNRNLSKFGKTLQQVNPLLKFVPGFLVMYGAFSKKSKPEKEGAGLTGKQKANNFIRDNAGKLAFFASVPILLEEAMATYKGQKFAEKLLKPELAKKVLKGNSIAYLTYAASAILGGLGAYTAVAVKDKIIARKEAKSAVK